jgi:hypothetical protein
MDTEPVSERNIIKRVFRNYKTLGIWSVVVIIVGWLIQSRFVDWVNSGIDSAMNYLAVWFKNFQLLPNEIIGYLIILVGFTLLGLAVYKAQKDIQEDIKKWKIKTMSKGLQIVYQYHQFEDGDKNKTLYLIFKNDEDVPLALNGELPPLQFGEILNPFWQETDLKHSTPLMSHVQVEIEPKKYFQFRLARTDVEKGDFWVDSSINNPPRFHKRGFYLYKPIFRGETKDGKKYEVSIEGYLKFWGGTDLEFVKDLPNGISFSFRR